MIFNKYFHLSCSAKKLNQKPSASLSLQLQFASADMSNCVIVTGSTNGNNAYSSHEEWLNSDCDAQGGKPFSVGHTLDSHTEKVKFIIGSYVGKPDQCVTIIGTVHVAIKFLTQNTVATPHSLSLLFPGLA